MPSLKWTAPVGKPRTFSIFKKITSIGSAGGNDVCIEHESLRDYHAQIIFDGRDFNLSEVDTDGKILLNGKKKRRAKLIHNDRLTLGERGAGVLALRRDRRQPAHRRPPSSAACASSTSSVSA